MGRLLATGACATMLALVTGCASNPLRGQRVARYRPRVDGRDVTLPDRMVVEPPAAAAGTNNAARTGTGMDGVRMATRSLQVGDKVAIYLFGIPEPGEIQDVIDDRGNVKLPLIESVKIAGRTTYEAEKMIESAFVDRGYYRKIEISVVALSVLAREDGCYVRGEVKRPGRYPWTADLTLMKAIIGAGGFTEYANPRKVQITRGSENRTYDTAKIEKGEVKDPPIKAGDIIIVRRGWV